MDVVVLLVALRDIVCPPTTVDTLCWGLQPVPGVETPTLSEGRMLPWCSWTAGVTDVGGCWAAEDCCCCGADERGPCGGCGGICGCCGGTAEEGGGAWGPSCWKLNVWLDGTAISVGPEGVCICCRCMGPCDVNRRRTCKHAKISKVTLYRTFIHITLTPGTNFTCEGDVFGLFSSISNHWQFSSAVTCWLTFILRAHQTFKCPRYKRTRPRALQPFKSTVHSCIGLELWLHSLSPNFIMVCDQIHAPANLPNYVHTHLTNSKSLAIL